MPVETSTVEIGFTLKLDAALVCVAADKLSIFGYFVSGDFERDVKKLVANSDNSLALISTLPEILSQEKRMADQLSDLDTQQASELAELQNLTANVGTLATLFNTLAAAAQSPTPVDVSKEIAQGAAILNGLQLANATIAAAIAAPGSTGGNSTGGDDTGGSGGTEPAVPVVPAVPDGPAAPDPTVVPGGGVEVTTGDDGQAVIAGTGAPAAAPSDDASDAAKASADTLSI